MRRRESRALGRAMKPTTRKAMDAGLFGRVATIVARGAGRSSAFVTACLIIGTWAVTGPLFAFSDTWQLVINTGTTIITFLMVFLIQNTQNRDAQAMQIKLDEIIRAVAGAHNSLLDLEELTQEDLDRLRGRYVELARRAREGLRSGRRDTGIPDVEVAADGEGRQRPVPRPGRSARRPGAIGQPIGAERSSGATGAPLPPADRPPAVARSVQWR
jgi:low affinity Fe/Cu permease